MPLKILVKFPTRQRPDKFLTTLKGYIDNAADNDNIIYLISIDSNDNTMTDTVQQAAKELHKNVVIFTGNSRGKVHACNRDIHYVKTFDILVLGSDDMICVQSGWDNIIRHEMNENFADLDGVIYHPDGYTELNTMCIMGRVYYNRFNYIYHPDYVSLFCDNEFQEVSRILKKEFKSDKILFKHEHPVWTGEKYDGLMVKNEGYYKIDEKTYNQRKAFNFGL